MAEFGAVVEMVRVAAFSLGTFKVLVFPKLRVGWSTAPAGDEVIFAVKVTVPLKLSVAFTRMEVVLPAVPPR